MEASNSGSLRKNLQCSYLHGRFSHSVQPVIGQRFQDTGLKDQAIEAAVIASGSAQAVMDGRSYNRTIRFHKLV